MDVDVARLATGPLARVGVWLPAATIAGLGALSAARLVFFPDAVMLVTFLAALGWVAVGFGGGRVRGPFETGGRGGDGATGDDDALALSTAAVVYLTVTTALGWAVVAVFFL